ncbi:MAG: hypothetical protein ACRDKZ_12345 [Actinomycetota bacterium]
MNIDVAKSDKLKTLLSAIVLAAIVLWIGQPAVEAATRAVRIKGAVKTNHGSKPISDQGVFEAPGSKRALDVRTFGAGNGFLGAASCGGPLPATTAAPGQSVVTGIIITGTDATVSVVADALGPFSVLEFKTTAENPNAAFSLGNGLKATAPIDFTISCGAGTNGQVVLIGQDD